MICVLLQLEWPWQPNDTNTFFIYLCVSLYQEFFLKKKNITDLFCFARALQSFYFLRFLSWCMQALQRFLRIWTPLMKGQVQNVWKLNSQKWQDGTFVHYPFFILNIPFYLLYLLSLIGILFSLFICFDILWQLVTTHATGTQIVRAKWRHLMRFFAGETSRALALSLAVAKNLSSTCGQV